MTTEIAEGLSDLVLRDVSQFLSTGNQERGLSEGRLSWVCAKGVLHPPEVPRMGFLVGYSCSQTRAALVEFLKLPLCQ